MGEVGRVGEVGWVRWGGVGEVDGRSTVQPCRITLGEGKTAYGNRELKPERESGARFALPKPSEASLC